MLVRMDGNGMPVRIKPLQVVVVGGAEQPFADDVRVLRIPSDMLSIVAHQKTLMAADAVLMVDDGNLFRLPTDQTGVEQLLDAVPGNPPEFSPDDPSGLAAALLIIAGRIMCDICSHIPGWVWRHSLGTTIMSPAVDKPKDPRWHPVVMILIGGQKSSARDAVLTAMLRTPDNPGPFGPRLIARERYSPAPNRDAPGGGHPEADAYLTDVQDLAARIGLGQQPNPVLHVPFPDRTSFLAEALGPEGFAWPVRPQLNQEDFADEETPACGPEVGFVAFGEDESTRTVVLDISGSAIPLPEIITESFRFLARSTHEQRAAAQLREAAPAKAEVDAMPKTLGATDQALVSEAANAVSGRLHKKRVDAGKQKAKVTNPSDRKAIRDEVERLANSPCMTKTAAYQQAAEGAQKGRFGARKLTTTYPLVTPYDVRRISERGS